MAVRSSRPSCFRGPAVPSHQHAMAGAPRFARRLPCNHSHKLVILSAAKDLSAVLHTPLLLYVQKNGHTEHFWCTYRFAITLWQHFPQLYVQKNGHPEHFRCTYRIACPPLIHEWVVWRGSSTKTAFLVLEWLVLAGSSTKQASLVLEFSHGCTGTKEKCTRCREMSREKGVKKDGHEGCPSTVNKHKNH